MNFTWLAWADFLLRIILSHQSFGLVNGFNLLLQGDVGLCCLLCTSHASRVAIPSNLYGNENTNVTTTFEDQNFPDLFSIHFGLTV